MLNRQPAWIGADAPCATALRALFAARNYPKVPIGWLLNADRELSLRPPARSEVFTERQTAGGIRLFSESPRRLG